MAVSVDFILLRQKFKFEKNILQELNHLDFEIFEDFT